MEIINLELDKIKEYKANNKDHKDNLLGIVESLELFGFQFPILIDKDYFIISGHGRYNAAKKLKLETIPVIISDLDEDKVKEFRIIDNVTQAQGKIDYQSVKSEIELLNVQTEFLKDIKTIISDIEAIKPLDPKVRENLENRSNFDA